MRNTSTAPKALAMAIGGGVLAAALASGLGAGGVAHAGEALAATEPIVPNPQAVSQQKQLEFAVFKKNCTQCHNSVADPERPGKTRDEWYRIVNLMERHGLDISQQEADMIVDLLYALRPGIEKTPG